MLGQADEPCLPNCGHCDDVGQEHMLGQAHTLQASKKARQNWVHGQVQLLQQQLKERKQAKDLYQVRGESELVQESEDAVEDADQGADSVEPDSDAAPAADTDS